MNELSFVDNCDECDEKRELIFTEKGFVCFKCRFPKEKW